jgi:hypothetical protein
VTFLAEDQSHIILPDIDGGIEAGLHGDRGANGSKGTHQRNRQPGPQGQRRGQAHGRDSQPRILRRDVGEPEHGIQPRPLIVDPRAHHHLRERHPRDLLNLERRLEGSMSLATMMLRQRELRMAKEAAEAQEKARAAHRASAAGFWDNIDTSGGDDACHLWQGARRWNHPATYTGERYESAIFEGYEGCDSVYAGRVACFAVYGRNVPEDHDVTAICGERLCINLRHLAVVKHGGCGDSRLNQAVPIAEFFCSEAA